ncbi:vacuolar protein sorting-associated [Phakopsora pachyrhizi]|uniref:Vacuolar protein sorting-associated protein 28 n=1 Tax=Phakopsora pachyrhizi TaxID=170000 RepID=A0AAV0AZQ8_PHAPC|nr:vacuolar protein sorting-associated [Phakopsora pachyrhizi]CAH7674798.1 vacuolar protein sorting-associated [Phakopsora pachyrhizi]
MAINLDEEFRLYTSNADREKYDNEATLYSIILSLDYLERAYVRDSITQAQYGPACSRLLAQYKTIMKMVINDVQSLEAFMVEYRMDCKAAAQRIRVGVPATVEHSSSEGVEAAKWVAETTQSFITFMDALKLKLRAKDQLHPLLSDLMVDYSRFPKSQECEGRPKILHWLITLNSMRASDEITEDQSRQMLFDIEAAYQEFFKTLS